VREQVKGKLLCYFAFVHVFEFCSVPKSLVDDFAFAGGFFVAIIFSPLIKKYPPSTTTLPQTAGVLGFS
jgi:hypothetical protein